MKMQCVFTSVLCLIVSLQAKPKEGKLVSGKANIFERPHTVEIVQTSKKAILEWKEFSLKAQEMVRFVQPENGIILNKITSNKLSEIHGLLKADAHLYLMNPNGVIVGKEGVVKAKSFFVMGQNMKENEFFNQNGVFHIDVKGSIINQGVIQTNQGKVFFIGKEIKNSGLIQSEQVHLVSGSEIWLQKEHEEFFCVKVKGIGHTESTGFIKGAQVQIESAGGDIYPLAINQKGIIEATGTTQIDGRIFLSAEKGNIEISGQMQAENLNKGGEVEIQGNNEVHILDKALICANHSMGGGFISIGKNLSDANGTLKISIDPGSKIQANAIDRGDGGNVLILAHEQNIFQGNISAKGGALAGDGGFVEISCPKHFVFLGHIDTTAGMGKTGKLLLDPSDIIIDDFGGSSTPTFPTTPPGTYNPIGSSGLLDVANLQTALGSTNVTISTAAGTGGAGTVTINSGLSWSSATTFSVMADRNIILDGVTITNTNALGGFTAVDLQANQNAPITGNFNGIFLRNTTISSTTGSVNLLARGGTGDNNYGIYSINSTITSTGIIPNAATVTIDGTAGAGINGLTGVFLTSNSSVNSNLGDISITGLSNGTGSVNHGIWLQNSGVISNGVGINSATITLDGTSSSGANDNFGIWMQQNALVSSDSGNIDITAVSNGVGIQNMGMVIESGSGIESVGTIVDAATLIMNVTSGTGTNDNKGMMMRDSAFIRSVNGNLDFMAESRGNGTTGNQGLLMRTDSFIQSTGIGVDASDITVVGIPGAGEEIGTRADLTSDITVVAGNRNITGGFQRGND